MAHLRAADPVFARILDEVGPYTAEAPQSYEPFRVLARAIVFQQLSGKAATTIFNRFVAQFEGGSPFPDPAQVLALPEPRFREAGLSRQKTAALLSLAEHFASGELAPEAILQWEDEDVVTHLTRVRGIGRWSAEMFLLFQLQRADVLPVNDVGVNRAIMRRYGLGAMPKPAEVLSIGAPWRPWASVACWYLWRSEDTLVPEAKGT